MRNDLRFYTLDDLRERLKEININALARKLSIHFNTLHNLTNCKLKSLNFETYLKLVEYFEGVYKPKETQEVEDNKNE